jgi:hypothetical protein
MLLGPYFQTPVFLLLLQTKEQVFVTTITTTTTSNNNSNWNQKITKQHTGKAQNQETSKQP